MTFAMAINVVLGILCVIVVIQSLRMVRGVQEIRSLSFDEGVAQMDSATQRAQAVLTELKTVLDAATTAQNRAIVDGEALRDELSVMIGIGNAVAERIMDAADARQSGDASDETDRADDQRKPNVGGERADERKQGRPEASPVAARSHADELARALSSLPTHKVERA